MELEKLDIKKPELEDIQLKVLNLRSSDLETAEVRINKIKNLRRISSPRETVSLTWLYYTVEQVHWVLTIRNTTHHLFLPLKIKSLQVTRVAQLITIRGEPGGRVRTDSCKPFLISPILSHDQYLFSPTGLVLYASNRSLEIFLLLLSLPFLNPASSTSGAWREENAPGCCQEIRLRLEVREVCDGFFFHGVTRTFPYFESRLEERR